MTFFFHET